MLLTFPDGFDVSQEQMIKKRQFLHTIQNNPLFCLIIGTIGGFLIGRINQYLVAKQNLWCLSSLEADVLRITDGDSLDGNVLPSAAATTDENLVLIGVMTAKKYLQTRVVAARDTWANNSTLRIIFFTSEGSEVYSPDGVEVVGLRGVDDSYPPQKKSFLMLKYMHDHYKDQYRFFMRADDDVYIKIDRLSPFLHSIDTSNNRALFIGQAGLGNKNEFGMLELGPDENFCMGGPTMVLSRETLVRVVPHVGDCLGNLYTTHEDVEVGRCVSRYAGVSCTWSYEMQKIFYNNYKEPQGSFTGTLKDPSIRQAITLHPFKNTSYMYRAHHHFLSRRAAEVRNMKVEMSRRVNRMNDLLKDRDEYYAPDKYGTEPSMHKFMPRSGDEVVTWDFLDKHIYSDKHANPRRNIEIDLQVAINDVISQLMETTNNDAREKGRQIDFKDLLYGYRRVVTPYSADYILDLLLTYRKFKGKQKMTIPVRRHVYVQQTFLHPEAMFDPRLKDSEDGDGGSKNTATEEGGRQERKVFIGHDIEVDSALLPDLLTRRVNFILPLLGRHETFVKFMRNFEEACLQTNENVSLHVVLFKDDPDSDNHHHTTSFIEGTSQKYPSIQLTHELLEGPFSRGVALQNGASRYRGGDLLFFIDVDMAMRREVLMRVRLNAVAGKQVYYPTVFSQYNPKYVCHPLKDSGSDSEESPQDKTETEAGLGGDNSNNFNNDNSFQTPANGDLSNQRFRHKRATGDVAKETDSGTDKFKDVFASVMDECQPPADGDHGDDFDLRPHVGYWREFGFGIAAMYKEDFDSVGGFDLEIKGWGKEDVDLVERFISRGYSVFRSVDPGLVHVYHSIHCSLGLDPVQYRMCLGSKASSYASLETLAKIVLSLPAVIDRNLELASSSSSKGSNNNNNYNNNNNSNNNNNNNNGNNNSNSDINNNKNNININNTSNEYDNEGGAVNSDAAVGG